MKLAKQALTITPDVIDRFGFTGVPKAEPCRGANLKRPYTMFISATPNRRGNTRMAYCEDYMPREVVTIGEPRRLLNVEELPIDWSYVGKLQALQ